MNYFNRRLLLRLEDDGLTVDDIILFCQTHSLIGYTMKERNRKFQPCHSKSLVEFGRRPRSDSRQSPIPRRRRCCHSDRLSTPPLLLSPSSSSPSLSLYVVVTSFNIGGGRSRVCRRIVEVVSSHTLYDLLCPQERYIKDDEPVLVAHRNSPRICWRLVILWKNEPVGDAISRINPLCR